jgi:hypothetical protein
MCLVPLALERMHLHRFVLEEEFAQILINALVNQPFMEMSVNSPIVFKLVLQIVQYVLEMEIVVLLMYAIVIMVMLEKIVNILFAMEYLQTLLPYVIQLDLVLVLTLAIAVSEIWEKIVNSISVILIIDLHFSKKIIQFMQHPIQYSCKIQEFFQ